MRLPPTSFCALASVIALVAVMPVSTAHASGPERADLHATTLTLANGLQVVFDEDHRTPVVTVNLWYHVGSKDEAPHRNGFAHLFEHVMFQGSKHVPEDTYFRFLEQAGATSINGTTNTDRTNYFETVPKNRLELALWLESDRMASLLSHASETTFRSQREVVKNERRQNYENAPYGMVSGFVRAALFPSDHPYARLTIGSPEDLDAATFDDVKQFFRANYVPNNATLVLSGDIDREATEPLVVKWFGTIPRGSNVPRKKPITTTLTRETRLEIEASVELARVYIAWPSPAFFAPGDGELDLVSHILAGGKTSRLYRRLVYDMQIAQSVSVSQSSSELESTFDVVATAKPGHSGDELLRVIDEELANLRANGIASEELMRAQTVIAADTFFDLERSSARANRLNTYVHYMGTPNYLAQDLARTATTTVSRVTDAARAWLKPNARVVAIVTPNHEAPTCGRLVSAMPARPARGEK